MDTENENDESMLKALIARMFADAVEAGDMTVRYVNGVPTFSHTAQGRAKKKEAGS